MGANQLKFVTDLTITSVECCKCGHLIFMSTDFERRRRDDHNGFHCTSCGQNQSWRGKSELELAREAIEAERQRKMAALAEANDLRSALAAAEEQKARLKRRVSKGVCPCCNRTVSQMARHIATKHPEYAGGNPPRGHQAVKTLKPKRTPKPRVPKAEKKPKSDYVAKRLSEIESARNK